MRSRKSADPTFTQTARRAQIIAAAIEVIAEVGWAQTSIRKIADRVGIAMSAVLYHFGNKDALVEAVITDMYRSAVAAVAPAIAEQSRASDRLDAYIRASIAFFDSHRSNLAALSELSSAYRASDGRSLDVVGREVEAELDIAALDPRTILSDGQQTGEFGSFPIESVALAIRGAVNASVEQLLHNVDFDATIYAQDITTFFRAAVRNVS